MGWRNYQGKRKELSILVKLFTEKSGLFAKGLDVESVCEERHELGRMSMIWKVLENEEEKGGDDAQRTAR